MPPIYGRQKPKPTGGRLGKERNKQVAFMIPPTVENRGWRVLYWRNPAKNYAFENALEIKVSEGSLPTQLRIADRLYTLTRVGVSK